jgi:Zn-dependent protease with chaperone function
MHEHEIQKRTSDLGSDIRSGSRQPRCIVPIIYFLLIPSALLSAPLRDWLAVTPRSNTNMIAWEAVYALVAALVLFWSFAIFARWLVVANRLFGRSNQHGSGKSLDLLGNGPVLLVWFWCVIQPVFIVSSGWLECVETFVDGQAMRSMSLILMLLPSLVVLFCIELGRLVGNSQSSHTNTDLSRLNLLMKHFWVHSIYTWLLPFTTGVLVAGVVDGSMLVSNCFLSLGLKGSVIVALVFSIMATVLSPQLFVMLLRVSPIDSSIETRVQQVWRLGSNRLPRILHWPTGCRVANAAVVGMIGCGRKLLLTDALLQLLTDRELEMVVLHELAHCVRFHAWIRILPTLGTIGLLLIAMQLASGVLLSMIGVVLFGAFLAGLIGVCWWTEFDADRIAIKLGAMRDMARQDQNALLNCEAHRRSADELILALRKVYGEGNLRRSSWMHPSCERRMAAIQLRVATSPASVVEIVRADA